MSAQVVYIARHGLTEANVAQIVQGFDDPLTEAGHRQAMRLAERAKHLEFDRLIASDMHRAQQTAHYIATVQGMTVTTEPLVREVVRPASLHGLSRNSESYQSLITQERANFGNPDWRYEDGENFADAQARALAALDSFAAFGEETLFVVSHGHFIRFIVATVMMERALTAEVWAHASRTIRTHNTGITILRRDIESDHWSIVSVNDHAHFADD